MQRRLQQYFSGVMVGLLTAIQGQAQISISSSGANTNQAIRIYDPLLTRYTNVEGSPYVPVDSVQQGWLVINTKRVPTKLRYNSQTGEVEYIQDNKVVTPVNPVSEFVILWADTLLFRKGFPPVGTWSANDFYQVLYDGRKTKLVKHIRSDLKSNTDVMQDNYGKERFQKREEYYVWIANAQPPAENYFLALADGQIKSVVASKKALIGALPRYSDLIEHYVSDQKIKLKSWSEFASVLRHLESQ